MQATPTYTLAPGMAQALRLWHTSCATNIAQGEQRCSNQKLGFVLGLGSRVTPWVWASMGAQACHDMQGPTQCAVAPPPGPLPGACPHVGPLLQ